MPRWLQSKRLSFWYSNSWSYRSGNHFSVSYIAGHCAVVQYPGYPVIQFPCRCIIAFAGYCIVGAVVNKVHFKTSGSDTIPNKNFWMDLPLLIKVRVTLQVMQQAVCIDVFSLRMAVYLL